MEDGLEEELVSSGESVREKLQIEGVAMRDPVKQIVNGVNGVSGHLILKTHVQMRGQGHLVVLQLQEEEVTVKVKIASSN